LVVDIFGGSNTTGETAEELGRRWLYLESDPEYAIASAFRFMGDWASDDVAKYISAARRGKTPFKIDEQKGINRLF
jgi:hypothetical protein